MSTSLFASLPRADQRKKGVTYVKGLLKVTGRKSIRNIANLIGGRAVDQSLHHFISESTWDWMPVRQALTRYLVPRLPVEAWVVQNTVIRKAGQHSVGVDRRFVPAEGRVLNAQQAVSVWAASGRRSSPVDWDLHLPRVWIDDGSRRSRASIPDSAEVEPVTDRAAKLCVEMMTKWAMPVRPVVLDARAMDVPAIVNRLGRRGIPLMSRIDESLPLVVTDPALTGYQGSTRMQAWEAARACNGSRRPVRWLRPGPGGGLRTGQLATVTVRLGSARPSMRRSGAARPLTLIALSESSRQQDAPQLWVTDLTRAQPAALLALCTLLDRVEHDYAQVSKTVGIEDYVGRSFEGWHRHMTLASAAHAVSVLASADVTDWQEAAGARHGT
ncbi:IS701 family transposase (plasmid) [Streptomyces sp. CWNU-52B]|uniref:IS701 family transposase n=1 Tax=unclassified Streptomyces TaxID=2593676 RepID=UPI0039C197A3